MTLDEVKHLLSIPPYHIHARVKPGVISKIFPRGDEVYITLHKDYADAITCYQRKATSEPGYKTVDQHAESLGVPLDFAAIWANMMDSSTAVPLAELELFDRTPFKYPLNP